MKRISRDWRTLSKLIDEGLDPPILDEYTAGVSPICVYDSMIHFRSLPFLLTLLEFYFWWRMRWIHGLVKDFLNSQVWHHLVHLWQVSFELRMIKIELASLWVLLIVLIVFTDFHHSSILLNNIFILEILIKNKHQMDFDH